MILLHNPEGITPVTVMASGVSIANTNITGTYSLMALAGLGGAFPVTSGPENYIRAMFLEVTEAMRRGEKEFRFGCKGDDET